MIIIFPKSDSVAHNSPIKIIIVPLTATLSMFRRQVNFKGVVNSKAGLHKCRLNMLARWGGACEGLGHETNRSWTELDDQTRVS